MTSDSIQDKRDGMELALVFLSEANPEGRRAILNTFQNQLSDYLIQLLDASLEVDQAMWIRAKAIGIVETLTKMGVKISRVSEPIVRPAKRVIHQSLNLNE